MSELPQFLIDKIMKINLPNYHDFIIELSLNIKNLGCNIDFFFIPGASTHREEQLDSCIILIRIKEKEPLCIIWEILHEFGHHQSGKKNINDNQVDREKLAWRYADEHFLLYPELQMHKAHYNAFKNHCLSSYNY